MVKLNVPKIIICQRCGRERKHEAKGLCASCYVRVKQIAQGDEWLKKHAQSEKERRKKLGAEYRRRERERNKRRKEQRQKNMRDWQNNNREHIRQYFKDYRKREPQKNRAREAIHHEVRMGRMPSPLTLQCLWCDKPATGYHHHRGYSEEFKFDVIPICPRCHGKTRRVLLDG